MDDFDRQGFEDLTHTATLFGVAGREFAGSECQTIFETDAHVTTQRCTHRSDAHLNTTDSEMRDLSTLAKKSRRAGVLKEHDILRIARIAAGRSENGLNEHWPFAEPGKILDKLDGVSCPMSKHSNSNPLEGQKLTTRTLPASWL